MPGTFPGSGSLPPSTPLPSSPAPAASLPLSPSGLSGLAQLPGTPSQKPSTLPSSLAAPATAPRQGANELVHPFELTVFHARVHYWSGDPLGYVDALSRILGKCKQRAREEGRVIVQRRELGEAGRARGEGDAKGILRSEQIREDQDQEEEENKDEGKDDAEVSTESTEVQDEARGGGDTEGTRQSEQTREDQDQDQDQDEEEEEDEGKEDAEYSTVNAQVQDETRGGGDMEGTRQSEQTCEDQDESEDEDGSKADAEESTGNAEVQDEEDEEQDDLLAAAEANLSMWVERIARVCLILASQMIEMNVGTASFCFPLFQKRPLLAFLSFCSRVVGIWDS